MIAPSTVTLSTGLVLANFGSPHAFAFDDGSVLPAAPPEHTAASSMTRTMEATPSECGRYERVTPVFSLPDTFLDHYIEVSRALRRGDFDLVIVPFGTLQAMKREGLVTRGFATISLVDRATKTNSHRRFCP